MAYLIELPTISDERGSLTVLEGLFPAEIQRIYWIYGVSDERGGHRHKVTTQGLVCLSGSCEVYCQDVAAETTYSLSSPNQLLIVEPKDWHTMDHFSEGAVLLVVSSHKYDRNDYIDEPYKKEKK